LSIIGVMGCNEKQEALIDLKQKMRAFADLEGIRFDSKDVEVASGPRHLRLWVDHWRDGKMIETSQSQPGGMGPVEMPSKTRFYAVAREDEPRSGRFSFCLSGIHEPNAEWSCCQPGTLSPPEENESGTWTCAFFDDRIVIDRQPTPLLALFRDGDRIFQSRYDGRLGGKLEAIVLMAAFSEK